MSSQNCCFCRIGIASQRNKNQILDQISELTSPKIFSRSNNNVNVWILLPNRHVIEFEIFLNWRWKSHTHWSFNVTVVTLNKIFGWMFVTIIWLIAGLLRKFRDWKAVKNAGKFNSCTQEHVKFHSKSLSISKSFWGEIVTIISNLFWFRSVWWA